MSADNDLLLDNAAVCSQHPALEDSTVRECITLNVISPLRRELAILREQLAERDAELDSLRRSIVAAIDGKPCPTPAQWTQMQAIIRAAYQEEEK